MLPEATTEMIEMTAIQTEIDENYGLGPNNGQHQNGKSDKNSRRSSPDNEKVLLTVSVSDSKKGEKSSKKKSSKRTASYSICNSPPLGANSPSLLSRGFSDKSNKSRVTVTGGNGMLRSHATSTVAVSTSPPEVEVVLEDGCHCDCNESGNAPAGSHFRKRSEKTAMVLITIVLTFLFCHTFRLVIKAYEVTHPSHSTPEHHVFCVSQGRFHVPAVLYVLLSLSHLLLAVNSSINFIIYCCVGKRFRTELKLIMICLGKKIYVVCCKGSVFRAKSGSSTENSDNQNPEGEACLN